MGKNNKSKKIRVNKVYATLICLLAIPGFLYSLAIFNIYTFGIINIHAYINSLTGNILMCEGIMEVINGIYLMYVWLSQGLKDLLYIIFASSPFIKSVMDIIQSNVYLVILIVGLPAIAILYFMYARYKKINDSSIEISKSDCYFKGHIIKIIVTSIIGMIPLIGSILCVLLGAGSRKLYMIRLVMILYAVKTINLIACVIAIR
ncbi:MAG: hypothetical protein ACI4DS_02045 [Eubacterium sp.]